MPAGPFLQFVKFNIVHQWSLDRDPQINPHLANPNYKIVSQIPDYSLSDFTLAYQWTQQNKKTKSINSDSGEIFYIPAKGIDEINSAEIALFRQTSADLSWDNYDFFKKNIFWTIAIDHENWKQSKCSCPYFAKNYKCKHIIGVSARLKVKGCVILPQHKTIQLGQKRKRGRPALAKKALIRQ